MFLALSVINSILQNRLWRIGFHYLGGIRCLPFRQHFGGPAAVGKGAVRKRALQNHFRILWYYGSEVVILAHQKILNRNNRCALEEENVEMTCGLQEEFVFWSWVLSVEKKIKLFSWLTFLRVDVLPRQGWKKGRQILTPLQRKTAETKQQNLYQLCTVKYSVHSVHSWTDVQGCFAFCYPCIHIFVV